VERARPRRRRSVVQRVWQFCWKARIRSLESAKGWGRGWRVGWGGAMLKALWGVG
jgi:hypothetical protein